MPVPPKPASRRQRRNTRDVGLVPVTSAPVARRPPAPAGVLSSTRSWWGEFWSSRLAALVEPTDVAAVRRLATLYDERERCYRSAQKGRLVEGSTGQVVLNPLYKHVGVLDSEIRQLEDRFGLTPMARLKLGVQFGEASRSLEELNRLATLDVAEEEDPRVVDSA